jgi:hypothetical protein
VNDDGGPFIKNSIGTITLARFVRDLFRTSADLAPDTACGLWKVVMHGMANPRSRRGVQHLLEQLNATVFRYPGTNCQLEHHLRVYLPELPPVRTSPKYFSVQIRSSEAHLSTNGFGHWHASALTRIGTGALRPRTLSVTMKLGRVPFRSARSTTAHFGVFLRNRS